MDEELEKQTVTQTLTSTEQEQKQELKQEIALDNLRYEDLLKSEQEIKPAPELKGLTQAKQDKATENRVFKSKEDEKKSFVKKRVKIASVVYLSIVTLLFGFVIFNTAALAILGRGNSNKTNTIKSETEKVEIWEDITPTPENPTGQPIEITLNEPRDYSDDTKELTFFDKLTIMFRNIFG